MALTKLEESKRDEQTKSSINQSRITSDNTNNNKLKSFNRPKIIILNYRRMFEFI